MASRVSCTCIIDVCLWLDLEAPVLDLDLETTGLDLDLETSVIDLETPLLGLDLVLQSTGLDLGLDLENTGFDLALETSLFLTLRLQSVSHHHHHDEQQQQQLVASTEGCYIYVGEVDNEQQSPVAKIVVKATSDNNDVSVAPSNKDAADQSANRLTVAKSHLRLSLTSLESMSSGFRRRSQKTRQSKSSRQYPQYRQYPRVHGIAWINWGKQAGKTETETSSKSPRQYPELPPQVHSLTWITSGENKPVKQKPKL